MHVPEIWAITLDSEPQQFSTKRMVMRWLHRRPRTALRVLDLGCGTGDSVDFFRQLPMEVEWIGLDIESSPEVDRRVRTDTTFQTYDGVNIPAEDNSIDLVYSHQVFEHVRHPEPLLREVSRVLKWDGAFCGGVSYLEPYHSRSLWNFTPYGWWILNRDAGLTPVAFAAGIDSLSLIERSLRNHPVESGSWWTLSPLNAKIISDPTLSAKERNYRMLSYCGHLVFECLKLPKAGS